MWYSRHQPFQRLVGVFLLFFSVFLCCYGYLVPLQGNLRRGSGDYSFFDRRAGCRFRSYSKAITDVVVAPFGGILLCIGSISLLSGDGGICSDRANSVLRSSLNFGYVGVSLLWGLVMGIQGISWSKSGLGQVRRAVGGA